MATRTNLRRARRGAAWLDEKLGRGWRRKIRRRRLDMQMGYMSSEMDGECGCILTQLDYADNLSGHYGLKAEELGLTRPVQLGFIIDGHSRRVEAAYADLTEAWLEVLREGDRR